MYVVDLLRFGTSGIRGVFNRELGLKDVGDVCFALDRASDPGVICVGYDTRMGSKVLAGALTSGLNYYGRDVVDLGVVPTPLVAFAVRELGLIKGVSVTASHNPPEYSGIKIFDSLGMEVPRGFEETIEGFCTAPKVKEGGRFGRVVQDRAIHSKYVEKLISRLPASRRRLKILVDCGNGAASSFTPKILGMLGHRVFTVNSHQSSQFPGRAPEPTAEALKEVSNLMSRLDFDIGVAHDGDGDRIVVFDERGRVIPDQTLTSLMLKIVARKRRGVVVLSVNTSNSVERVADEEGCRVVRARLGKTFIELKRVGGIFASEPSKVTDPEWGFWEDGIYIACLLVQYISRCNEKLSEVAGRMPLNFNYQRNIPLKNSTGEQVMKRVLDYYKGCGEVEDLDGVKIRFKDGSWILFRVSGTEPKVRVYVDSESERRAVELLEEGVMVIKGIGNLGDG